MSSTIAAVVEFLSDQGPRLAEIVSQDKKRLTVRDAAGRSHRLSPDKVLFEHRATELADLARRLDTLSGDVDVALLWETLLGEDDLAAKHASELSQLYFDEDDALHSSALFRAINDDRLFFRRRGVQFAPRTRQEVEQVRRKREAEDQAAIEQAAIEQALRSRKPDSELCARLERWLRGAADKQLDSALASFSGDPRRRVFELLIEVGRLSSDDDLEVVQANLTAQHPRAAIEHAESLPPLSPPPEAAAASFAIDDPDTREVDDALSAAREGELIRIDIDIADVAASVARRDPVDREALRRATTVYLPTERFYMLPEAIGCDRASLLAQKPRRSVCTSIWIDDSGRIARFELSRRWIAVQRQLDYDQVDELLASPSDDPTAVELKLLRETTDRMRQRRIAAGALSLRRPEWKLHVDRDSREITVKRIRGEAPARLLVAELMIATNHVAGELGRQRGIPLIFRAQPPPDEPLGELDDDAFVALGQLRGRLKPAGLSLHPARHYGLGLDPYSQVTSPLRRYGDLVLQRQLCAYLDGEPPPYTPEDLLEVLAAVEATEQQSKRIEAAVTQRWAIELAKRQDRQQPLDARVVNVTSKGARVVVLDYGAEAALIDKGDFQVGQSIEVRLAGAKPRRGQLRVALAR